MKTKTISILLLCVLLITSFVPVVSAASNITVSSSFDSKSVRQDEGGSVDVSIKNDDSNQVRITWVGLHFDWLDSNVFYVKDLTSSPIYLASGQSTTVTITFSVGQEIDIGSHSYYFQIDGEEDTFLSWVTGTWTGQTKYDFNVLERDRDGDGVADSDDAFPDNSQEWSDSDNDGVGNNADVFPYDSTEWKDSDGDGIGDNSDLYPYDATNGASSSSGDSSSDSYSIDWIPIIVVILILVVIIGAVAASSRKKPPIQQYPPRHPPQQYQQPPQNYQQPPPPPPPPS